MDKNYLERNCSGTVRDLTRGLDYQTACKRMAGLMHIFVGSAYGIAQGVMVDAAAELRQHKNLYRHQVKQDVRAALQCYDTLFNIQRRDLGDMFDAWLDAIDIMDDDIREHLDKMFWSIDGFLLRHNVTEHRLVARMETACAVVHLARHCFVGLCLIAEREVFRHKVNFSGLGWYSFKDVEFHWERACNTLSRQMGIGGMDIGRDETCRRALQVIANKLTDFDHVNDSVEQSLDQHPEVDPRIEQGIETLKRKYNNKK